MQKRSFIHRTSQTRWHKKPSMSLPPLLLVEDDPRDVELALAAIPAVHRVAGSFCSGPGTKDGSRNTDG